jgi:hypothetical protein
MAAGSRRRSSSRAREQPKAASGSDGRTIRLVTQASVIVGLISGTVGLLFVLIPGLRPGGGGAPADQSARVNGIVLNPHTTHGQYLDYADQSRLGFTRDQLAIVGASVFARVQIVGYRGTRLTLERQIVNARTGDVVGQARDFTVIPTATSVTHRWFDWVPLRAGTGSYVMVIKVLDKAGTSAIACGESPPFGGLDGIVTATPPQLCET